MLYNIFICLMVGYLFGCISTSYIVGRMYNIDIREHGSGNAGTTNTMRILGKKAGILVYLGDCIKCALAIFIMVIVFSKTGITFNVQLIKLVTGFGVVLGHNFPFWLNFKGGKGIAVTSAVILIFSLPKYWICPVIAVATFALIVKYTKYVSLGSLTVVTIFLLYVAVRFVNEPECEDVYLYMLAFAFFFALSAFYMHRANIVRLMNGTENKIGEKKKSAEERHRELVTQNAENYIEEDLELDCYNNNEYSVHPNYNCQNKNYKSDKKTSYSVNDNRNVYESNNKTNTQDNKTENNISTVRKDNKVENSNISVMQGNRTNNNSMLDMQSDRINNNSMSDMQDNRMDNNLGYNVTDKNEITESSIMNAEDINDKSGKKIIDADNQIKNFIPEDKILLDDYETAQYLKKAFNENN